MNVLMVIPALDTGGAEWAFVRQANALTEQHSVTAYVPWACDSTTALMNGFDGMVRVVSLPLPHRWCHKLIYKMTLLFPKFDLEQRIHSCVLRVLHRIRSFDVVNPHLRGATMMVCKAFKDESLAIVETDHGDYALLKQQDPTMQKHQLLRERVDAVICLSRANEAMVSGFGFRTTIIPNVMPTVSVTAFKKEGVFTFGMVARGIAEKGWAEALAAFRALKSRVRVPIRLLFVGAGPALDELQKQVADDEGVIFAGYQPSPADWVAQFDVGLLPSYFAAESLPYAIIECLVQGKPVIATDVGGIAEMLKPESGVCGKLVPLDIDSRADVLALTRAMESLATDQQLCSEFGIAARKASARYLPENFCEAFTAFVGQKGEGSENRNARL